MAKPAFTVLDRKPLFENEELCDEWRLIREGDSPETRWIPYRINKQTGQEVKPVWAPLPGGQMAFLSCPVFEALLHGPRGGGKTLVLLMDFAREVGKGYGKAWRGILFRRTFGDLDDVVRKIEDTFPKMFPGFRFLKSKSEYTAVWPTGEALLLRHMIDETEYPSYHGHEYPWIGWEELTQWDNDKAYKLMFSCCRPPAPNIPCRIRATTNPSGVGHSWVRKRFQLPHKDFEVIHEPQQSPRTSIRAGLSENFVLLHSAPDYIDRIRQAATSPSQERAWLYGDWTVTAGGMFDDLWEPKVHIIPTFPAEMIPKRWTITRAYDHGQSSPFAVGWWLESNGEPMQYRGVEYGRVRGDLILYAEWYGTKGGDDRAGLRMDSHLIAQGILDREADLDLRGRVQPGPADTEIWTKDSSGKGIAPVDDMEALGVYWDRADKSGGSRSRGWQMIRSFLRGAKPNPDGTRDKPGMFVADQCHWWINIVPELPRDIKDQDDIPGNEDHLADMTRYRVSWVIPGLWRRPGL